MKYNSIKAQTSWSREEVNITRPKLKYFNKDYYFTRGAASFEEAFPWHNIIVCETSCFTLL